MKLVVFDFDGTLTRLKIDWVELKKELNEFLEKQGVFHIKFGRIIETLRAIRQEDMELWNQVNDILTEKEIEGLKEKVNDEIFKILKEYGFKIAIWSRNSRKVIEKFLGGVVVDLALGREDFFEAGKKDKDLKFVIEKMSVPPKDCIVVTDHPEDVSEAKKLGCFVIGIESENFHAEELEKSGADVVVKTINNAIEEIMKRVV